MSCTCIEWSHCESSTAQGVLVKEAAVALMIASWAAGNAQVNITGRWPLATIDIASRHDLSQQGKHALAYAIW